MARQGIKNLLRHRGRTMLTVLGVIVGCCSVVIMISIGIGMRLSSEATLAQMGDLSKITVNTAGGTDAKKLDDAAVSMIRSIEHAQTVIPKVQYNGEVTLYAGSGNRYQADYITIVGEDLSLAEKEGYQLTEGEWDALKSGEILVGEYLAYAFKDTKRPEGHNQISRYDYYDWEQDSYAELPDSYVDFSKEKITLTLGSVAEGQPDTRVSQEFKVGGILKEDWSRGYETSEGLIMDAGTLQSMIEESARKQGEKQKKQEYSQIIVLADNISNVEAVEKEIKKLGFQTSSMDSIRKPMEQDMQQKQMLLGCVGAVSLFVAALGIANTMIMAITERFREIGVMKALGCYLKDIRRMFLLEAGCIGLGGGIIGIGLSYLISFIMNKAGTGAMFGGEYDYLVDSASMDMSVIPWWLAVFAIVFSVLVGVLAGLYPSQKAVRISVLEAIKHE